MNAKQAKRLRKVVRRYAEYEADNGVQVDTKQLYRHLKKMTKRERDAV